ncbi:hypothetical protein F8154_11055 [Alkaliphilus pronyensis]|uniref:Uncharacterized protein n=1 Tax=Alkaliphilus pronyensis TaxID=1482732 RepID=A0A6I0FE02_9FIRM|nr:hypothetical protein [Alkaliphilus pronyensis]KAB3532931.1 hypothetical protein F8154_11055 [Alkaliphilus pronyensis]
MEWIKSDGTRLEMSNEGATYTIIQKYKNCSCKTVGKGENHLARHCRAKKICGENCLRYRYNNLS